GAWTWSGGRERSTGSAAWCDRSFFFQAEDGIRDWSVTGVQTCALPIFTAIMSRAIDRGPARGSALAKAPVKSPLTARRFSTLEEAKKKAALARIHKITNAVCRGMDLAKETEIVEGLALGDTLLLERGRDRIGFAICHAPGVSEAPAGALYVKYLAIDPPQRKP